jgi:glycosyl transferase, family 25
MNVYVVNLRRRPDRRLRMERLLPPELHPQYTTGWTGPLDGHHIHTKDLVGFGLFPWQIPSDNPWWSRPLKLGEIGCAISHWSCWRRAAADGADRALIFEDDVVLVDGWTQQLPRALRRIEAFDHEWDLLYLGRWVLGEDQPVAPGIVRPGYSYCSYAYMLSAAGLAKVLASRYEADLIPIDELLSALFMDHPRPGVRRRYPKCLSAYALEPPLVTQLPKAEAGSDTEEDLFVRPFMTRSRVVAR